MSRTAQSTKIIILTSLFVVLAGASGGVWYQSDHQASKPVQASTPTPEAKPATKTDHITYQGEEGKTALVLLKTRAKVVVKSSSLGDYVTSVNGNDGGGKKYWLFYVNGKEADTGAGAYITKATDTIEWKLQ